MSPIQIIFLVLLASLIFWAVGAYNRLVRLTNTIDNAFGHIDAQLKRRYDVIPNLVEACRKYPSHEGETMKAVISARNQAQRQFHAALIARTFRFAPAAMWQATDCAVESTDLRVWMSER